MLQQELKKKKISIIAPAYNHEKYIKECLLSVLNQDYPNKELIIIDDFSTDNTVNEIEKILKNLNESLKNKCQIKFIKHQKNMGAHATINEGIELAEGDFITIINTDDFYEEGRLSKILQEMEKKNCEIAFGAVEEVDGEGNINSNGYFLNMQKELKDEDILSQKMLLKNYTISTGNLIFSKEIYRELEGFSDYKYIHDWDFILRASLDIEPLFIKEKSYFYRVHETNTFKTLEKDENLKIMECNAVLEKILKSVKGKNVKNKNMSNLIIENILTTKPEYQYLLKKYKNL